MRFRRYRPEKKDTFITASSSKFRRQATTIAQIGASTLYDTSNDIDRRIGRELQRRQVCYSFKITLLLIHLLLIFSAFFFYQTDLCIKSFNV